MKLGSLLSPASHGQASEAGAFFGDHLAQLLDECLDQPGAFVATCHSGVTLAAVHSAVLAPHMAWGRLPEEAGSFSAGRLHVSKTA